MATIIKASGPIRAIDGASFNFDDVTTRANSYLDTMRVQASEILAQARREADAIRKQAEADGKQAAIQAVEKVMEEKVGKQLATLIPAVKQAVEQLAQAKHAWLTHWEGAAVHVAARIAERVVRKEIEREPTITVSLVREALELASGTTELQVRMNPSDVKTLGSNVESLLRELGRQATATVVGDATIAPGGCCVDTKFGVIDQQIESQLRRIEEELI
jgi:flagellar biosynthesis/type III secretory pathway protein FliH